MLAANIKNLLAQENIEVLVKNEFASGAVGDLSAFDTWIELWLINDKDESKAMTIINSAIHPTEKEDWFCRNCKESNASSFELCWNCQHPID